MKTAIFNKKQAGCETCRDFYTVTPSSVNGKCNLHRHILINVYRDNFCDYHKNKSVSGAEVSKPVVSVAPFSPGWQAEQRKAYAKWYNNK